MAAAAAWRGAGGRATSPPFSPLPSLATQILIASNGIGAVKCIRSIRKWAYEMFGSEKEVHFIVMTTPQDLGANAEYIRMVRGVRAGGGGGEVDV